MRHLRYCYASRRATQNMSASNTKYVGEPQFAHHCYKPTWLTTISSHWSMIAVSLAALLSVNLSAFNNYKRQNAYHRNFKCIFEDLLPCYCYATKANSRTIRSRVSQSASADREANLMIFKLITACYQNSEPDSFVVWVSYRQTNCHCKKLIQMIRIKLLISRFLQIFAS